MVRTANPLEAEISLIQVPIASASFLYCAEVAAETVPLELVLVALEDWLSAPLAKTQSPPIQSPQSNNQWFPIPNVATEVLASKVNVSVAVFVVKAVLLAFIVYDVDVAVASAE